MSPQVTSEVPKGKDFLSLVTSTDLGEFLVNSGWKNVESSRPGWSVFFGPDDYYGEPLEIVLSDQEQSRTYQEYIVSALELLAELREEPVNVIALRVHSVNQDVLTVRNLHSIFRSSIPLKLASRQVSKLQALVKQATFSESDARPHYPSGYRSSLADKMSYQFQFGHTQNSSFGLTIKSPTLWEPREYSYRQPPLPGIEEDPPEPDIPVARRIMERVMRGLIAAKEATSEGDVEALVSSYPSGFNANMCKAVAEISPNQTPTVEYGVLWSPKISPSPDLANIQPILLGETDYEYLKLAHKRLIDLEPEQSIRIRGLVEALTSPDDPRKLGAGQSIVVRWQRPEDGRVLKLYVDLSEPAEYRQAIEAHENYRAVEITGNVRQIGARWRLLGASDFRVAD